MEVKGKKVLVFGLGISGIGAGQILERHGAEVIMYDGNPVSYTHLTLPTNSLV